MRRSAAWIAGTVAVLAVVGVAVVSIRSRHPAVREAGSAGTQAPEAALRSTPQAPTTSGEAAPVAPPEPAQPLPEAALVEGEFQRYRRAVGQAGTAEERERIIEAFARVKPPREAFRLLLGVARLEEADAAGRHLLGEIGLALAGILSKGRVPGRSGRRGLRAHGQRSRAARARRPAGALASSGRIRRLRRGLPDEQRPRAPEHDPRQHGQHG